MDSRDGFELHKEDLPSVASLRSVRPLEGSSCKASPADSEGEAVWIAGPRGFVVGTRSVLQPQSGQ